MYHLQIFSVSEHLIGQWNEAAFNGHEISQYEIRRIIESEFQTIEVVSVDLALAADAEADPDIDRQKVIQADINQIFILNNSNISITIL